jgi:hypothetical protein
MIAARKLMQSGEYGEIAMVAIANQQLAMQVYQFACI